MATSLFGLLDAKSMSSLKNLLKDIGKELREKEKVREAAKESMRRATRLSKQAILLIHQKKMDRAKRLIEEAKENIFCLSDVSPRHPETIPSGLHSAALQEYSEANIFMTMIEESRFITPQEINVPSVDYVLGLVDVIGEYRRSALDALRQGDAERGERCLQIMDEVYTELIGLDEALTLVPGLRRKCDVARKIIEATRGDVTQEVRRSMLEKQLKEFENSVRKNVDDIRRMNT